MSLLLQHCPVNLPRSAPPKCITFSSARVNLRRRTCETRASLISEISAISDEKYATVVAAAVIVPVLMFGMAVGAGYLLKRRVRIDAMNDLEDYIKLVNEGMDEETAKNTILSRIEIVGPDLRRKRKRRQVQVEEQSDDVKSQQEQEQQQQPQENQDEQAKLEEKVEVVSSSSDEKS